jgi:molecular chaperone DnaK (HSP70)
MAAARHSSPAWRTCIDFGTAASKASTCAPWSQTGRLTFHVHPLRLGAICQEANPFVAQSALLFDGARVFFGWNALKRATAPEVETDVLHSFKTFLAAADLNEALRLRLKRSVDRSGSFTQRDALVLYVAYLLYLTERAMALDPSLPAEAREAPRRYAYPTWRAGAGANTIMAGIFDAAASVAATLGERLVSEHGVDLQEARAALAAAFAQPGRGRIEAGVYEAQAAAECHFAFTRGLPDHVMVFDMGAGTTDITAFERSEASGVKFMREMTDARRTILLACDEIDKLLVSFIVERAKSVKQKSALKQFWRKLTLNSRLLKEDLFKKGVCEARWGQTRIVVRLGEFMRDKQFNAFRAALASNFRSCLTQTSLRAVAAGSDEVGVVLAGGGAALPFIQEMARRTRPASGRIRHIAVQPLVPEWAMDETFKRQLAPIFPQVAISIGGAVAHVHATDLHF